MQQLPLHLWLPRAVVSLGIFLVAVLATVIFINLKNPLNGQILGWIGGIWAICRVLQFLLMTRGAQAVLIWVGGTGQVVERE